MAHSCDPRLLECEIHLHSQMSSRKVYFELINNVFIKAIFQPAFVWLCFFVLGVAVGRAEGVKDFG